MIRIPSRSSLVLSLLLAPALASVVAPEVAHAQSTPTGERRVLKATDMDIRMAQSKELEEKAHQARLESIDRLKELIKSLPEGTPADTKAEMLLRLSDLYFEEGRMLYLQEMAANQEAVDKCFNTPGCKIEDIKPDNVNSRSWQDKSIKLYRQILQFYPQFGRADEATFYLGQALNDTGQADAANAEFTRLVKVYPDSKWVPDAYILIGEYFFDNKGEAFKALSAYQKATAFKEHEKWAFAMYKLAWCFYNVGDYGKSIETMKAVVSYAATDGSTQSRSNIQLQDEALKDLVRFFADAGDMDEAIAYFNKLGKKELIRDLLKKLAGTYVEQGKFENAIQMFRRLIAEDPQSPAAPDFQNEIIAAYTKMGKKEDTLAEIDRLRSTYGKTSGWRRANAANQEAVKSADEFIEKNLRVTATNYHNEAKKLGTGAQAGKVYQLAEQAYRTYLTEFPEGKYAYDVRYAFGELLYKVKKYDEAYEQYMKVVGMDPKGQYSKFCAESAIFAADEMLKKEKAAGVTGGPDPGKKTDAMPLTDWEQKSLAALDQYAKLFPDDSKVRNIIYKSAYLLYNKNQFKEASERFNVVIKMDPKSREAEQAANLILDSFALIEDWDNLRTNSKFYFDQAGLGGDDFKKEVYGIYENASLKLIEVNFKKSQDKAKGAADYWGFYKEFPTSQNADLALNNASVYYSEIGRSQDALKVRLELVGKFPKSKFYIDQVASIGFDYENMANFKEAASWYEKLYALKKDHAGSKAAIFSAALFRTALGEWEVGIKNYEQYIATFPGEPNINALKLEIAKIYEDHQKWPEAAKVYTLFFADPKKAPTNATADEIMYSRMRYGLLMDKLGQGAKATQHWKDSLTWYGKAREGGATFETGGEFAAQMLYILAEPQFKSYMAMRIKPADRKMPQKQENKYLKDQLVAKLRAMQEMEKTYTGIIATGAGEWGLASLCRLGQVYEDMAEALTTSAAPSYLTEDQLEIYRMQLEDTAYPNITRATEAYSQALGKAYELSLYNDETAFATRRLGELRPEDYPGLFEIVPETRFTAPSVSTSGFETEP